MNAACTVSRTPVAALLTVSLALAGPSAVAAPAELAHVAGYVDGSHFKQFAVEGRELVEVTLRGPLLRVLAQSFDDADPGAQDLSDLVENLDWVGALVIGVDPEDARVDAAMEETRGELLAGGWEQLARFQEDGEKGAVLIRTDDVNVDGIVVMVLDRQGGELVFANVAGVVDLGLLADLGDQIDLPGLAALATSGGVVVGVAPEEEEAVVVDAP